MESPPNHCKKPGYLRPTADPTKMSLSFAGCGFLCIYHAGVCAAIKEYAPELTKNKMYGASAGSIVAAGLITNVCLSEATVIILQTVSRANSKALQTLDPNFDLIGIVREGLDRMLPVNAHEQCSGRLYISLTRYKDFKNVVVSNYETRDELIQAILCSSFIPFYCGRNPPKFRGVEYCDGGLSDNQPVYDRNTITVSPFSGESDICPRDEDSASLLGVDFYNTSIRITTNNLFRLFTTLFPPSLDICAKICRQGFQDALVLLNKKGLAPCVRCLTLQSNMLILPEPELLTPKKQTLAPSKARRKLESECEVCYDNVDTSFRPSTDSLFPPILQKAIDDAKAAENVILRYLNSYRIFRWGRRFVAPAFLPLDFAILGFKNVYKWAASPATSNLFLQRFYATLDFILAEIARNNLLYSSQISKQLAPLFEEQNKPSLTYRLAQSDDVHFLQKEIIGELQVGFDDSIHRLIEFDNQRDEILIYFYTNFNLELQAHISSQNHRRMSRSFNSLKRQSISRLKMPQTIGTVHERESPEADDSGYTEPESSAGNSIKRRKDTCSSVGHTCRPKSTAECCCNTARQCSSSAASGSQPKAECSANAGCIRRHTFGGSKQDCRSSSIKSVALSGPAATYEARSSDSDDNGEKFFVPNRPTSGNENGYEGGESDTDH